MTRMLSIASCLLAAAALPTAAQAQQAGDFVLRAGVARTKLVDKGQISVNGVVQPDDGYRTRDAYHGIVSGSYLPSTRRFRLRRRPTTFRPVISRALPILAMTNLSSPPSALARSRSTARFHPM